MVEIKHNVRCVTCGRMETIKKLSFKKTWFNDISRLKRRYQVLVVFWDFVLLPYIVLNSLIFAWSLRKWVRGGYPPRKLRPDFVFDPIYWFKRLEVKPEKSLYKGAER